jgi:hypothetical protein
MRKTIIFLVAIAMVAIIFSNCKKEEDEEKSGQINLEITDAPSDDANIQGTFITVSMIRIDGDTVEGFEKQTINISSYQNGETKLLFAGQAEAKSYSNISLELDFESDVAGNSPGCYVIKNNEKQNLAASLGTQLEITFEHGFTVEEGLNTDLVIDFDLRKSIKRNETSAETDYSFVADADLKSCFRLVEPAKAGIISGEVSYSNSSNLEFIVYVYKKGEYSFIVETQGQGSGNVMFAKAVTSSKVKQDGTYTLAFLEEGDYEIHVASYSRTIIGGRLNFTGMANAISLTPPIELDEFHVSPNTEIELDISIAVSL